MNLQYWDSSDKWDKTSFPRAETLKQADYAGLSDLSSHFYLLDGSPYYFRIVIFKAIVLNVLSANTQAALFHFSSLAPLTPQPQQLHPQYPPLYLVLATALAKSVRAYS